MSIGINLPVVNHREVRNDKRPRNGQDLFIFSTMLFFSLSGSISTFGLVSPRSGAYGGAGGASNAVRVGSLNPAMCIRFCGLVWYLPNRDRLSDFDYLILVR